MKRFLEHWVKVLLGPVVAIGLLAYQQVTGKPLTWGWFTALILAGFAWHFYSEFQKAKHDFEVPKLSLIYADGGTMGSSGFFVQTEGEKQAFGIKISSEDAIGREHMRLEMVWADIPGPVGNEPIPVSMLCSLHMGNASKSFGGRQILSYFEEKATEPKELIAVLSFKDVEGKTCPPKKFRITKQRDVFGRFQICCELIPKT